MVNGSPCKISGAVGHSWEYAHAQWADDRVAALHMHGGLRMRSKRTTTWQLLTRGQIETKLIVSLCFWSPTHPLPVSGGLLVGGHSPLFTPRELRLELSIVRVGGVFPFGSRWGLAPCGIPVWGACPHYSGHAPQRVVAYCLISGPKLMVY